MRDYDDMNEISKNYKTKTYKIMVQKGYLENKKYPTFYWKIIASIYFQLFEKDMELNINDKFKSIYDIYVDFCINYKPFDSKYNNQFPDLNDKIIIYLYNSAIKNHFYESELIFNTNFLSQINFNNFEYSLLHFRNETKDHIYYPMIDYDFLCKNSRIVNIQFLVQSKENNKILENIIKKILGFPNHNKILLILRKICNGFFEFNLSDFTLIFDVIDKFFANNEEFIMTVLFYYKHNFLPNSIVYLLNKSLYYRYVKIELSLEWIVSNCYDNSINNLLKIYHLSNENYFSVCSKCKNIDIYRKIHRIAKEDKYDNIIQGFEIFITSRLKNGEIDFGCIDDITTDYSFMMNIKYELLSFYIEQKDYDTVLNSNKYIGDIDFTTPIVANSVGRSLCPKMFNQLYQNVEHSEQLIYNIVIGSISTDNLFWVNKYPQIISMMKNDEIVRNIIPFGGINLYKMYRSILTSDDINIILHKCILNDNYKLFTHIYYTENIYLMNRSFLLIEACKNNKEDYILLLIDTNASNCIKILNLYSSILSIKILNMLFCIISKEYDLNDTKTQTLILEKAIINILLNTNLKTKLWLKSHIKICDILSMGIRTRSYSYISSDSESEVISIIE